MNQKEIQIVFVRHGLSEHNALPGDDHYWYSSNPDHPSYRVSDLRDAGRETVTQTAGDLVKKGIRPENSIAFVSPLPRTQQTAAIFSDKGAIGAAIVEKNIIEVQAGGLEGKYGQYNDKGIKLDPQVRAQAKIDAGYETAESVAKRVHEFVTGTLALTFQNHPQKEKIEYIVIISHDETLKHLISAFQINDPNAEMLSPGTCRTFSVPIERFCY